MRRNAAIRVAVLGALAVAGAARPAAGQSNVKVVLSEVVDDRISDKMMSGGLVLALNLEGEGLDAVKSARFRLKEAKTESGQSLLDPKAKAPDFTDRNVNGGTIQLSLSSPPREASKARVSGTAELFVPSRDPASVVKVPGFLSALDKPLASKALKSNRVDVTVLSREAYAAEQKKNRLDEKKIALIRAEGKERGMKDEEIDALVEMAKAFDGMGGGPLPENVLLLKIGRPGYEKVQDLWVETAAGEKIESGSSQGSGSEDAMLKQIEMRSPLPKDAVLVLSLFTDKAIVSVPFELKEVVLP